MLRGCTGRSCDVQHWRGAWCDEQIFAHASKSLDAIKRCSTKKQEWDKTGACSPLPSIQKSHPHHILSNTEKNESKQFICKLDRTREREQAFCVRLTRGAGREGTSGRTAPLAARDPPQARWHCPCRGSGTNRLKS